MISYGKHYIDESDIEAVVDVLRHGTLTQGRRVDKFEEAFSNYVGVQHAVAVSSGTAALHLACLAADLKQGDNVITSANTFVASANCAAFVGATPIFSDINPVSLNMSPCDLRNRCGELGHVEAIIPVHFGGLSCDMRAIGSVASEYDAVVIEDACHALGGTYASGERVGSCCYSDMTVFSFHPVKAIAAGEGGMITTNDTALYERLIMLRSHGIFHQKLLTDFAVANPAERFESKNEAFEDGRINPWYFEMQQLGYNYRLTEIQCVLAQSQLKKLDKFVATRHRLALRYDEAFADVDLVKRVQLDGREQSAHHLYVLRIDFQSLQISRGDFIHRLLEMGVGTQVHYIPVPLHPYYKSRGYLLSDYPETASYYQQALTLPLYYDLADEEQALVIESIRLLLA